MKLVHSASKIEKTVHLFVKCPVVQSHIWAPLRRWLKYYCNVELGNENVEYEILFNRYKDSFQLMINTIILIVKQFIYAKKCLIQKLNFLELVSAITRMKNVEEYIAKKNGKIQKHNKKWLMYDQV